MQCAVVHREPLVRPGGSRFEATLGREPPHHRAHAQLVAWDQREEDEVGSESKQVLL